MVTDKSAQKAEKQQQLAENEELLEATQIQLKEDEEFFETARQSCKDKSDAWDERSRLRTEELSGINKALEILTSDDARATFQSAHDTRAVDTFGSDGVDVAFVQLSAEEEASPQGKAYRALKKVLRGNKTLMLARLAGRPTRPARPSALPRARARWTPSAPPASTWTSCRSSPRPARARARTRR